MACVEGKEKPGPPKPGVSVLSASFSFCLNSSQLSSSTQQVLSRKLSRLHCNKNFGPEKTPFGALESRF